MTKEDLTSDALPEEDTASADSAGGEEAVGNVTPDSEVRQDADSLSLQELNEHLGKEFPNRETALKALKDTFSYVGKKVETTSPQLDPSNMVTKEEFETAMFYKDNPAHAENRDLLDALAAKHGVSHSEAVELDAYKNVFEKVQGYEKSQSAKSVLESNPRLSAVRDSVSSSKENMNKSFQAAKDGDVVASESAYNAARGDAVKGVLDAFED